MLVAGIEVSFISMTDKCTAKFEVTVPTLTKLFTGIFDTTKAKIFLFQLNVVVSGALDRLHSEKDPCVKYDVNRKIWIYLHRCRTEEEFGKGTYISHHVYPEKTCHMYEPRNEKINILVSDLV